MDPSRRRIACGWKGTPEAEGIFLTDADIEEARFFVGMGGGRSIDVWRVDVEGLDVEALSDEGGWWICRTPIQPERLALVEVWDTSSESQMLELESPRDEGDLSGGIEVKFERTAPEQVEPNSSPSTRLRARK